MPAGVEVNGQHLSNSDGNFSEMGAGLLIFEGLSQLLERKDAIVDHWTHSIRLNGLYHGFLINAAADAVNRPGFAGGPNS
jgi:hypothetical protein